MRASVPVDAHDPGQALACMGIVEVLVLLGHDATSWFDLEAARFVVEVDGDADPVRLAVDAVMDVRTDAATDAASLDPDGGDGEEAADGEAASGPDAPGPGNGGGKTAEPPVTLTFRSGNRWHDVVLDLWSPTDGRPACKFHAGRVTGQGVVAGALALRDLLRGADGLHADPFSASPGVSRSVPRYGLDTRTARGSLANGWSPNEVGVRPRIYPLVELLSLVGAQRVRLPERRDGAGRRVEHVPWTVPLPPVLARHALAGALPLPGSVAVVTRVESSGKFSTLVRGGVARRTRKS